MSPGSCSSAESSGTGLVPIHQVHPVLLNASLHCWVSSSCWQGEQGCGRGSLGEDISEGSQAVHVPFPGLSQSRDGLQAPCVAIMGTVCLLLLQPEPNLEYLVLPCEVSLWEWAAFYSN